MKFQLIRWSKTEIGAEQKSNSNMTLELQGNTCHTSLIKFIPNLIRHNAPLTVKNYGFQIDFSPHFVYSSTLFICLFTARDVWGDHQFDTLHLIATIYSASFFSCMVCRCVKSCSHVEHRIHLVFDLSQIEWNQPAFRIRDRKHACKCA